MRTVALSRRSFLVVAEGRICAGCSLLANLYDEVVVVNSDTMRVRCSPIWVALGVTQRTIPGP